MTGTVKFIGSRIDLSGPFGDASLPIDAETQACWTDWVDRYRRATAASSQDLLHPIGAEMFAWLDSGGWATKWLGGHGPRCLEIASDMDPGPEERTFLSLPWELLANTDGFLAEDAAQPFEVWRRIGAAEEPPEPTFGDLSLLFMAAAPRNVSPELGYEREEAAILSSTEKLEQLSLHVEESGCVDVLALRARQQASFDAYHFSCHGDLLDAETADKFSDQGAEPGPNLLMETEDGSRTFVSWNKLVTVWDGAPPSLVFLSACRTSEEPQEVSGTFAETLARNVPAVIGWDGSVADPDATAFAATFYFELAGYKTVSQAAASARRQLLQSKRRGAGPVGGHWHLARLWLGAKGGGALCRSGGELRRLSKNAGYSSFLDSERGRVPVAGPLAFVGRRRFTQDTLKAFRQNDATGVLLFGIGNVGKSSLAARVANRLPNLKTVVVFQDYDAVAVLDAVCDAVPPADRQQYKDTWRDTVRATPPALALALETLLEGPLFETPILLIVDDLERILQDLPAGQDVTTVKPENGWSDTIAAILSAFRKAREKSRLLFTSRMAFSAVDAEGRDLASDLERIPLTPFTATERRNQWRAELSLRLQSDDATTRTAAASARDFAGLGDLVASCLEVASGNPGLQDILTKPLLSGEFDAVEAAIDAIRKFKEDQENLPDEENKAFEFFRRMTFERYKAVLTPSETTFLQAAALFGDGVWPNTFDDTALASLHRFQVAPVPVPLEALRAVGLAAGISDTQKPERRLTGLGLLDVYAASRTGGDYTEVLVNDFARPFVENLTPEDRADYAKAALPPLSEIWARGTDEWPRDARAVEALRLKLLSDDES